MIGLLVALVYRTSRTFGLLGDTRFLIEQNEWMRDSSMLWRMLSTDYFDSPAGVTIGYWRPLTKASWWLETQIGGGSHGVYHAVQVFWIIALGWAVYLLARRVGAPAGAALCGALVAALHPALIEPGCLVMARSDLVVGSCAAACVASWVAWRSTGKTRHMWACVVAAILAFASKEAAIVLVPLLIVWVVADRITGRKYLAKDTDDLAETYAISWWVALAPVLCVAAVYLVMRGLVLADSSSPSPAVDPLRWLTGMAQYGLGLVPLQIEITVRNIALAEAKTVGNLAVGAAAALVWVAVALIGWRTQKPALIAGSAWVVGSLTLVLIFDSMNVPGATDSIALSDRWMAQAVVALGVITAIAIGSARHSGLRVLAYVCVALWTLGRFATAPNVHGVYETPVTLLDLEDRDYFAAPEAFRTQEGLCRLHEREGVRAATTADPQRALRAVQIAERDGCPPTGDVRLNLMSTLVAANQFEAALPYALAATADPLNSRARPMEAYLSAAIFTQTGSPERAPALLNEAIERGLSDCRVHLVRGQAMHALGDEPAAIQALETGFDCFPDGHPTRVGLARQVPAAWRSIGNEAAAIAFEARL